MRTPLLNGIAATERIVGSMNPRSHVLVLTKFDLEEYVYDALRASATGSLLMGAPQGHLAVLR